MPPRRRDTSLGNGVYYAPNDYVGIGRRVIAFFVDGFVLTLILSIFLLIWIIVGGGPPLLFTALVMLLTWLYIVFCKRSPLRTLGYRLAGCRLVNLQGQRPSLFALTLRSLLWMFGPFNFLLDLIWCGIDEDRQTLRDRFAETCLINDGAAPIGTGEIHLTYFDIGTFNLFYPRVVHPKVQSDKPTSQTEHRD
jgi:uncharacterized RDD family membrane protein YckC